ncbi:MAG: hypothetical protein A2Z16_03290 [Chloroflexi bacterium RBG_16_54_18]|nr:MAG: hypothetical protein A2Z16_03290 [Chloroflexi bacterium RBG_16_54_18]
MRIFFDLLYHQFAWAYDFVAASVSLGMWKQWVRTTLPYLDGPRVLEIGHGPGHLLRALAAKGLYTTGLDESRWMGKIALKKLKDTTTTQLISGYAQFLPFSSASFNQVVATFPSEFILESVTLREIRRILVKDGSLVVLPFAWITGQHLTDRLARGLFHFTNQAPAWDDRFLAPINSAGFQTEVKFLQQDRSVVAVIRAFKLD